MSEKKKKGVVPRLRFPEFRDTGPWEVKRLGEVVTITGGGTPSRSVKEYWEGNIPWVSSSDISEESIHELKITRWINSEAVANSATKLVPKDSILLVSRVGVGKVAISRIPVCTSQDFTNLTPIKDDVIFLGYYLGAWANVLRSFSQGMAIQGFTKEDIESLNIPLPDANSGEQQKISDCLSSLDELIQLQTQKFDALRAHKKGLMQQLFPHEGETTPRLRFPEFRDTGPWEVKRLGEIFVESRVPSNHSDPTRRITVRLHLQGVEHREYRGTEAENATSFFVRSAGQFIYGKQNFHKGAFGIIPTELHGFESSSDIPAFDFTGHVVPQFVFYYLSRTHCYSLFEKKMTGTGSKRLHSETFLKSKIYIPSNPEQQKIADCLSSLDELIQLQTQKLDALEAHKKSLMQQLFPQEVE